MQQYPLSPDVTGQQQPPVYHQDPNAAHYQQQQQQQQQQYVQPQQQQYAGSPPPQAHPQGSYMQPQPTGLAAPQPGMPPQQPSGTVYQSATPIASLSRGPAPADCPACGQRSMTNTAFETGNTTQ
jgi:lipopolysaccharide-induced tumor necrosis factor-alpha factor